jgi:hypothetical protein
MLIGDTQKDDGHGGPSSSDDAKEILSPMQEPVSARFDTIFVSATPPEIEGVSTNEA